MESESFISIKEGESIFCRRLTSTTPQLSIERERERKKTNSELIGGKGKEEDEEAKNVMEECERVLLAAG